MSSKTGIIITYNQETGKGMLRTNDLCNPRLLFDRTLCAPGMKLREGDKVKIKVNIETNEVEKLTIIKE